MHCVVLVTYARERNEEKFLFKQTLKVTIRIITSLWIVFGLSTLISNRIFFHNLCEIEYPATETLEQRLATALRRPPILACSKGNRRRLHAGNQTGKAKKQETPAVATLHNIPINNKLKFYYLQSFFYVLQQKNLRNCNCNTRRR